MAIGRLIRCAGVGGARLEAVAFISSVFTTWGDVSQDVSGVPDRDLVSCDDASFASFSDNWKLISGWVKDSTDDWKLVSSRVMEPSTISIPIATDEPRGSCGKFVKQ